MKAETISELTGKMVLSDDSGLQVDVLGGLPGVWSARFAGPDATDDENNAKLLHELAMVLDDSKTYCELPYNPSCCSPWT